MDDPPLLEFDESRTAIIEPSHWHGPIDDIPGGAVITWMGDAFGRLVDDHDAVERHRFVAETIDNPIVEVTVEGRRVLAALASVGAPAAAALFEILISIGCTDFVAIGSSGGLVPHLRPGTVVVPDAAIRDEGVSYHYSPVSRLAHPDAEMQTRLRSELASAGHRLDRGTVWTTDALFRETPDKVASRVAEGSVAVDMEVAALATIARFRGVRIGHAVYLADTLHGDRWDPTDLIERDTDFRYGLLTAALRVCAGL